MPLLLLFIGLILTVTGAIQLSPFWGVVSTARPVGPYAALLLGLIALTAVVPWTLVRMLISLQTSMTDDLPGSRSR